MPPSVRLRNNEQYVTDVLLYMPPSVRIRNNEQYVTDVFLYMPPYARLVLSLRKWIITGPPCIQKSLYI